MKSQLFKNLRRIVCVNSGYYKPNDGAHNAQTDDRCSAEKMTNYNADQTYKMWRRPTDFLKIWKGHLLTLESKHLSSSNSFMPKIIPFKSKIPHFECQKCEKRVVPVLSTEHEWEVLMIKYGREKTPTA